MAGLLEKILIMNLQASILVIFGLFLRYISRRMSKWFIYIVWIFVIMLLLIPFNIENPISINPITEYAIGNIHEIKYNIEQIDEKANSEEKITSGYQYDDELVENTNEEISIYNIGKILLSKRFLFAIWVLGAVVVLSYYIYNYFLLTRKLRFAVKKCDKIWECEAEFTPCIVGVLRPKIYLPFSINERSKQYILLHENIHLRHLDPQIRFLMMIISIIHWWNPFVWLWISCMKKDMEMLCDESVIRKMEQKDKKAYMNTLLEYSCIQSGMPYAVSFGEINTERRIENMKNRKKTKVFTGVFIILTIVLFVFGCTAYSSDIGVGTSITVNLGEKDDIDKIKFVQGTGMERVVGGISPTENQEEFAEFWEILSNVSSEKEIEEYSVDGTTLYKPSIEICYNSGETIILEWDVENTTITCEEETYILDEETAQSLYDLFTEYCPASETIF